MSQVIQLRIRGLVTNQNEQISGDGALLVADNIVIDKEGTAQMRRGYEKVAADVCSQIIPYLDQILSVSDRKLVTIGGHSLGAITGPVHTAQAHSNLYLATPSGVMKLDSLNGDLKPAGVPKGLEGTASIKEGGMFLPSGMAVNYRIVWGFRDANQNLNLGSPSQLMSIKNKGNKSASVELVFPIPQNITKNHFFQIYRSKPEEVPSDELQLSFQRSPTVEELKSGMITVLDVIPTTSLQASLYTNETQEGILQGNDEPPIAKDLARFRDCMFYCNTQSPHRLMITLTDEGLKLGDTIKINEVAFTASDINGNKTFKLSSEPGAKGRTLTAKALIKAINEAQIGIFAFNLETDTDEDDTGKILLESKQSFTIASQASTEAFDPPLPQKSMNEIKRNAVYFSKDQQAEAVPMLNFFFCGDDNQELHRLIPLRDGLFAFGDAGIYRISGYSKDSFNKEVFDSTVKLLAPESCAVLSNHIFCLTNQGVVAVNDTGVMPISREIEDKIQVLLRPDMLETTKSIAFGLAYESDRKYILFAPTKAHDTQATQAFVYNTFTKAWSRWKLEAKHGFVHPTEDKIYLCNQTGIIVERKSKTLEDYTDFENPIEARIEWAPQNGGNPFTLKQWAECTLSFKSNEITKVDFHTELSPLLKGITFQPNQRYCRTYLPPEQQFGALQYVGLTCIGPFELEGMSLVINGGSSERISR